MTNINLNLLSLCALQELAKVCDRELLWIADHPVPCEKQLDNVADVMDAINAEMDRRLIEADAVQAIRNGW